MSAKWGCERGRQTLVVEPPDKNETTDVRKGRTRRGERAKRKEDSPYLISEKVRSRAMFEER
jgi:hypothetical protein